MIMPHRFHRKNGFLKSRRLYMLKNILVTGLILGKETNMCSCSNVNTEWLFERPSDLLWVDKIIMTQNEWNVITGVDVKTAFEKASKLIFERLYTEGIVQIIPDTVISKSRAELILENIETDLKYIEDLYKESNCENDPVMTMGNFHFCIPSLWTLYAAIELSMNYGANFSMSKDELAYLLALLPRKYAREIHVGQKKAIDEVLNLYLPSVELGNSYLYDSEKGRCPKCVHLDKCSSSFLIQIEKQLDTIIRFRQYDEIRMTCEVMDKLCERSIMQGHVLTGEELWGDLQEEANKTGRILKRNLPTVKWWRKISTYATIGLGAASFLNPIIGVASAIPALAGQLLADYEERQKKESSWINFVNNPESIYKQ